MTTIRHPAVPTTTATVPGSSPLPVLPAVLGGRFHAAAAGDTLESLARALFGEAGMALLLEQLNPALAGQVLSDGAVVRLPRADASAFTGTDVARARQMLGASLAADPRLAGGALPRDAALVQQLQSRLLTATLGGPARRDALAQQLAGLGLSDAQAQTLRTQLGDEKLGEFLENLHANGLNPAETTKVLKDIAGGKKPDQAFGDLVGNPAFLKDGVNADRVLAFITEKLPTQRWTKESNTQPWNKELGKDSWSSNWGAKPTDAQVTELLDSWRTKGLSDAELDKVRTALKDGKSLEEAVRGVSKDFKFLKDDLTWTRAGQWLRQQLPDNVKVAGGAVSTETNHKDFIYAKGDPDKKGDYVAGEAKVLGARAGAGYGVYINPRDLQFGVTGTASAEAYLVDAQGKIGRNWGWGTTELAGNAYVGARAGANATVVVDPLKGNVFAKVGAEAFVGARAGVSLSQSVGPVSGQVGVQAQVGIGANFNLDAGLRDGKLSFKLDVGAALGIGIRIQLGFSVDFKAIGKAILPGLKKAGAAVWGGIKKAAEGVAWVGKKIGEGAKKVGNAIASGAKAVGNAIADGAKSVGKAIGKIFKGW